MIDARIGRRYAQALFNTALKYDIVKSVEDDLIAIGGLFAKDGQFRQFLLAPYTSRDEKIRIAEKLFSDRITALTLQVLRLVISKGRETEIPAILQEFVRLRRNHEGIILVQVTSAYELAGDQRESLVAKLSQQLGKRVEAEYHVDPRLIGGIRVAYESYVLDGSVRGTLGNLREKLRHDLLKQPS